MSRTARTDAILDRVSTVSTRAEEALDVSQASSTFRRKERSAAEMKRAEDFLELQRGLRQQQEKKQNIGQLSEAISKLRSKAESLEDRADELDDELYESEQDLTDINARLAAAREELARCEAELPPALERQKELTNAKSAVEVELSTIQTEIDVKQRTVTDLETNMRAIMESFQDQKGSLAGSASMKWSFTGTFEEERTSEDDEGESEAKRRFRRIARVGGRFAHLHSELSAHERQQLAQDRWTEVCRAIRRGHFANGLLDSVDTGNAASTSGTAGDGGGSGLATSKSMRRATRSMRSTGGGGSGGVDPAMLRATQAEAKMFRQRYEESEAHYLGLQERYEHLHVELVALRMVVAEYDGDTVEDLAAELRFFRKERRELYDKLYYKQEYTMPPVKRDYDGSKDGEDDAEGLLTRVARAKAHVAKMMKENAVNPESVAFQAKVIDQLRKEKQALSRAAAAASGKYAAYRRKLQGLEQQLMEANDELLSGEFEREQEMEDMRNRIMDAHEKILLDHQEEKRAWNSQTAQLKDDLEKARQQTAAVREALAEAKERSAVIEREQALKGEMISSLERQVSLLSSVFGPTDFTQFDSTVHMVQLARPDIVADEKAIGIDAQPGEVKQPLLTFIETMYHGQYTNVLKLAEKFKVFARGNLRKNPGTEAAVVELANMVKEIQVAAKKACLDAGNAAKQAIAAAMAPLLKPPPNKFDFSAQFVSEDSKPVIRVGKTSQTHLSALRYPPKHVAVTAAPLAFNVASEANLGGSGAGDSRGGTADLSRVKSLEENAKMKDAAATRKFQEAELDREAARDELVMQLNQRSENESLMMQAHDVLSTSWEMVAVLKRELSEARSALEDRVLLGEADDVPAATDEPRKRRYFRPRYIQTLPVVVTEVPEDDEGSNIGGDSADEAEEASEARGSSAAAAGPSSAGTPAEDARVASRSTRRPRVSRRSASGSSDRPPRRSTPAEAAADAALAASTSSTAASGTDAASSNSRLPSRASPSRKGRRGSRLSSRAESRRGTDAADSSAADATEKGNAVLPGPSAEVLPMQGFEDDDQGFRCDAAPGDVEGVHQSDLDDSSSSESDDVVSLADAAVQVQLMLPEATSAAGDATAAARSSPRPSHATVETQTDVAGRRPSDIDTPDALGSRPPSTSGLRPGSTRAGSAKKRPSSTTRTRPPSASAAPAALEEQPPASAANVDALTEEAAMMRRHIERLERDLALITDQVNSRALDSDGEVARLEADVARLRDDRDHWRAEHDKLASQMAEVALASVSALDDHLHSADAWNSDAVAGDVPPGTPPQAKPRVVSRSPSHGGAAQRKHFTLAEVFSQIREVQRQNEILRATADSEKGTVMELRRKLEDAQHAAATLKKAKEVELTGSKRNEMLLAAELRTLKDRVRQLNQELVAAKDEVSAQKKSLAHAQSVADRRVAALKSTVEQLEQERDASRTASHSAKMAQAGRTKDADAERAELRARQRDSAVAAAKDLAKERAVNMDLQLRMAALERERDRQGEALKAGLSAETLQQSAKAISDALETNVIGVHHRAFSIHRAVVHLLLLCKNDLGVPVTIDDPSGGLSSSKLFLDGVERGELPSTEPASEAAQKAAAASKAVLQLQAADGLMLSSLAKALGTSSRSRSKVARAASSALRTTPATDYERNGSRGLLHVGGGRTPASSLPRDQHQQGTTVLGQPSGHRAGSGSGVVWSASGLGDTTRKGSASRDRSVGVPVRVDRPESRQQSILGVVSDRAGRRDNSQSPNRRTPSPTRKQPGVAAGAGHGPADAMLKAASPMLIGGFSLGGGLSAADSHGAALPLIGQARSAAGSGGPLTVDGRGGAEMPVAPTRGRGDSHARVGDEDDGAPTSPTREQAPSAFAAYVAGRKVASDGNDAPLEVRENWNRGRHMAEIATALEELPPRPATTIPSSTRPVVDLAEDISPTAVAAAPEGLPRRVGTPSGPLAGRHRQILFERARMRSKVDAGARR